MIKPINVGMLLAAIVASTTCAQTPTSAPGAQASPSVPKQQFFPTPKAAADALIDAAKNNDSAALIRILGERYGAASEKIDDAEERRHRQDLYDMARALLRIEQKGDAKAVLIMGRELWPLPIPLVKEPSGWRFDLDAGLEEMLARRIGENELVAIHVCGEYARSQVQYASADRDSDQVREYAQQLVSTPGKQDGLDWDTQTASQAGPSPLSALLPDDVDGLRACKPGSPHMGYYFKVLTRQGANPPGGKYDYVINGNMIAGFALVAWPADYRASGVMSFMINQQGKLLEHDLGPDTAKLADAMSEYNPDEAWTPVEP